LFRFECFGAVHRRGVRAGGDTLRRASQRRRAAARAANIRPSHDQAHPVQAADAAPHSSASASLVAKTRIWKRPGFGSQKFRSPAELISIWNHDLSPIHAGVEFDASLRPTLVFFQKRK
jgi:hypothetical protein